MVRSPPTSTPVGVFKLLPTKICPSFKAPPPAKALKLTSLPVVNGVEIVRIFVTGLKFKSCSSFWLSPSSSL